MCIAAGRTRERTLRSCESTADQVTAGGEDGSRAGYAGRGHTPPSQVIEWKLMLFASQATYCREEGQESVP